MNETTNRFGWIRALLLTAAVSGCSTPATRTDLIECTDPRPDVCTMDYTPVCGLTRISGYDRWKTYSNACTACSYVSVVGYREGSCDAVVK